jgi:hypothetical protein
MAWEKTKEEKKKKKGSGALLRAALVCQAPVQKRRR